jgi:glycosyltransferase involved in cell wall biosynthesis
MKNPFVSVIIPAFNEEGNISFVIDGVHRVLKDMNLDFELIVVNDGSSDKTAEIIKENSCQIINHIENQGKGIALKNGIIQSKGDLIVTMDADGSHSPMDLPILINPILRNDADVVIGSRFIKKYGKNSTTQVHIIGNMIINAIIFFLTGKYLSDSQSGFRAYKSCIFNTISISSSRYEIETELTVKILRNGIRLKEIPIDCHKRKNGRSGINSFNDGFKILLTIFKSFF